MLKRRKKSWNQLSLPASCRGWRLTLPRFNNRGGGRISALSRTSLGHTASALVLEMVLPWVLCNSRPVYKKAHAEPEGIYQDCPCELCWTSFHWSPLAANVHFHMPASRRWHNYQACNNRSQKEMACCNKLNIKWCFIIVINICRSIF